MTLGEACGQRAREAAAAIIAEARACDWRGPDPYDGLEPAWPGALVGGRRRRQVVAQLHARAPVDIRRVYRRRDFPLIAKTAGVFASAALRVEGCEDHARAAAALLLGDTRSGDDAWGYPWDVQTRWSFYPAHTPNVVVTTFCGVALHEAAPALGDEALGERARRAARWVRDRLYLPDRGIFGYHPESTTLVHNANVLGARLVGQVLGIDDAVRRAVDATLSEQAPDGSWPYGETGLGFVDSFHTGYVLESLLELRAADPAVLDAVRRGAAYYTGRFFGADGAAPLWPHKRHPLDAHAAGTGMTTLALLVEHGMAEPELLERTARWTVENLVRDDRVVPRRHRANVPSTVRYLRWCDAPVALGLANAARVLTAGSAVPVSPARRTAPLRGAAQP